MKHLLWIAVSFFSFTTFADPSALRTRTDTYLVQEISRSSSDVDILWVIDNSGSMYKHHDKIVELVPQFFDSLTRSQVRAKMGVVTTDRVDAPVIGLAAGNELYTSDALALDRFRSAVKNLGTNGSSTEEPLFCAKQALEKYTGFRRPGQPLVTIFVTDETDQSRMTAQEYKDATQGLIGAGDQYVYGWFSAKEFGCDTFEQVFDYTGSVFEQLIASHLGGQGEIAPLCGLPEDLVGSFDRLVATIASLAAPSAWVKLEQAIPSTVRVFYRGIELQSGASGYWNYDANLQKVIFKDLNFTHSPTDVISVTYEIR